MLLPKIGQFMIMNKFYLLCLLTVFQLHSIEHISDGDLKKIQLCNEKPCAVVYVYKSSPCPLLTNIFEQLEKELGTRCFFAVIKADTAECFFDTIYATFPTILFVQYGVVKNFVTGRTSKKVIKKNIACL